jgi:hypothetical protein
MCKSVSQWISKKRLEEYIHQIICKVWKLYYNEDCSVVLAKKKNSTARLIKIAENTVCDDEMNQ